MRKKATPARRPVGRPKKAAKPAAKRPVGRPPMKRARPPSTDRAAKPALTPAAAALSSHGLKKWIPSPGDLLITASSGTFSLGKKSWRKASQDGPSPAQEALDAPGSDYREQSLPLLIGGED